MPLAGQELPGGTAVWRIRLLQTRFSHNFGQALFDRRQNRIKAGRKWGLHLGERRIEPTGQGRSGAGALRLPLHL